MLSVSVMSVVILWWNRSDEKTGKHLTLPDQMEACKQSDLLEQTKQVDLEVKTVSFFH